MAYHDGPSIVWATDGFSVAKRFSVAFRRHTSGDNCINFWDVDKKLIQIDTCGDGGVVVVGSGLRLKLTQSRFNPSCIDYSQF